MGKQGELENVLGLLHSPEQRSKLMEELKRDEREEAVEELVGDCLDIFWQAGGGVMTGGCEDDDHVRAVMRLCWERWVGDAK